MSQSLSILLPEQELMLAGVKVVVHEYTLAEQLKHRATLKVLSQGFKDALNAAPNADVSLDMLYDFLGDNTETVLAAVSIACHQPVEWVAALTGDDSEALLMTWWGVNAPFFTRDALKGDMERLVKERLALQLNGRASLPASSPTDMTTERSKTIQPGN